jgi:Flp pilus assembly pilin Flp
MKSILRRLWQEDAGIVALEYLLLATIVGLGLVVGLAAYHESLTVEQTELANAVSSLDQTYTVTGLTDANCPGFVLGHRRGSSAQDAEQGNSRVFRQVPVTNDINVAVGSDFNTRAP